MLALRPTTRTSAPCASSSAAALEVMFPLEPRSTYMGVPLVSEIAMGHGALIGCSRKVAKLEFIVQYAENKRVKAPAISLARLAAFTAVADAGSFTAAAERLNTTKSAVSQAVAVIERELGTQLLQRSTRKLAITEAGEAFLADCRALLAGAEAAMERARTGGAQLSGTLRLTSPQGTAGLVAGWIATYRERYPALRVDYVPTDRRLDLIAERFDLAIRIGPMEDSALRAAVLEELEIWTVAAASYLARHGAPRKPSELVRHEWIAFSLLPSPWSMDYERNGRKLRVKIARLGGGGKQRRGAASGEAGRRHRCLSGDRRPAKRSRGRAPRSPLPRLEDQPHVSARGVPGQHRASREDTRVHRSCEGSGEVRGSLVQAG